MSQDRNPVPDRAEDDAFFPSPYSLTQYVGPKSDFDGTTYPKPYTGKQKVLVIGTQERYLDMSGKYMSTGNHPVETLLPMHHIHDAGFELDIATVGGDSVKLEQWAFPSEDETIKKIYQRYKPAFKTPLNLAKIIDKAVSKESPYAAVFIPGGHGALNGLPFDKNVARILEEFTAQNKFVITICHGPAALLAPANVNRDKPFVFKGYEITCFPDSLDEGANIEIGYIPGKMNWLVGESLEKVGVKIMNPTMTGAVHKDRNLLTGDSPLAANALGKLSASTLLEVYA